MLPGPAPAKTDVGIPRIVTHLEKIEKTLTGNVVQAVIAILLIAVATLRIVGTYEKYNQTFDEGAHIAAGVEILDHGTFGREPLYPPITRMAIAAGPYMQGARTDPRLKDIFIEGNRILYTSFNYEKTLAAARMGVLPFFWILCLSVFFWARSEFGAMAGVAALLIITNTQVILGHAGMATADIPAAATLVFALFSFRMWLKAPTQLRSLLLGISVSAALLTKLSNLAFLFVSLPLIFLLDRYSFSEKHPKRNWFTPKLIIVGVAFLCIWGTYRFEWHPLNARANYGAYLQERFADAPKMLSAMQRLSRIPIPAPDFIHGLEEVSAINADKRPAYLLGEVYLGGKAAFFPVALAVKSPFALLVLGLLGTVIGVWRFAKRHDAELAMVAVCWLVVLAIAMNAQINIGVRHILSIFGFWAILGGALTSWLLKQPRHQWFATGMAIVLLGWIVAGSWTSRAAPIAYFNFVAGNHPEKILVDSDLDWGQDMKNLDVTLRQLGAQQVWLDYLGTAIPEKHLSQQIRYLPPGTRVTGWVAISLTDLQEQRGAFGWLNEFPVVAKAGDSINIYYVQ